MTIELDRDFLSDEEEDGNNSRPGTASGDGVPKKGDPVAVAVRLRPPVRIGIGERFQSSDPNRQLEVSRFKPVRRLLANRKLQFLLILPNQIVFWTVIFVGLFGTVVPGLNFGAAITWYVWFCLVFVMMVVVGRAWCSMCPFGGFGEWIQRRTFWKRTQKALGLGKKLPEPIARYGFIIPVVSFLILTWIEEFFNIAGPGNPADTAWMVVGIVSFALLFFLVFERRTFCRYFCPLTSLIGTVGSMGSVAGFRTKDRDVCLSCQTKDCMRGNSKGFGCPWYTWPGSADSNLYCGLCTECYKTCPEGNVGLFVQKPLTSVVQPSRRRADVAWAIALLWGLVLFQQINSTNVYASLDNWLNKKMSFAHYPNPIDYTVIIGVLALITAGIVLLLANALAKKDVNFVQSGDFVDKKSKFRAFFLPMMYGLIPIVGADYFDRQLPKFFKHSARLVPSVGHFFGVGGGVNSSIYSFHIINNSWIVVVQVAIIALGTLGSLWAMWRISGRDLIPVSKNAVSLRLATTSLVVICGLAASILYVAMHAAS